MYIKDVSCYTVNKCILEFSRCVVTELWLILGNGMQLFMAMEGVLFSVA